jgi:hypothetical protein
MSKYYKETPLTYPTNNSKNSEHQFFGNGWEVFMKNEKYYFSYVSGQLAGRENTVEISKDDYIGMREGKLSFDDMCRRYGVN